MKKLKLITKYLIVLTAVFTSCTQEDYYLPHSPELIIGTGVPGENTGFKGDYYFDGTTHNLYGPKTDKDWGEAVSLVGATGPQGQTGAAGSTMLSGMTPPTINLGKNNDYYLDKITGILYGPKTEEGWGASVNMKGPKGDKGDPGESNVISTDWKTFTNWSGVPSDFLVADYYPSPAILSAIGATSLKDFLDKNGIILVYMRNSIFTNIQLLPVLSGSILIESEFSYSDNVNHQQIGIWIRSQTAAGNATGIDYYRRNCSFRFVFIPASQIIAETSRQQLKVAPYEQAAKLLKLKN